MGHAYRIAAWLPEGPWRATMVPAATAEAARTRSAIRETTMNVRDTGRTLTA